MEYGESSKASMTRYVLAYLLLKLMIAILLTSLALTLIDGEMPNLSVPSSIVCASLSIYWYVRRENRPLLAVEIVLFSIGTVFADWFLSLALTFTIMWASSVPISWEGLDAAMFGGGGNIATTKTAVLIGVVVGSSQVFFASAIFSWALTRKLPKQQ